MPGKSEHPIACQQVLTHDSTVFSIQWTTMPANFAAELTPSFLLERYLSYIKNATFTLIRPTQTPSEIEFRLLSTSVSLLTFAQPLCKMEEDQSSLILRICGGILVQPAQCNRGELTFSSQLAPEGVKVTLRLADYCPLLLGGAKPSQLRKLLYRLTQAYIHKVVTIGFLARIYRETVGDKVKTRIERVRVMDGEDT